MNAFESKLTDAAGRMEASEKGWAEYRDRRHALGWKVQKQGNAPRDRIYSEAGRMFGRYTDHWGGGNDHKDWFLVDADEEWLWYVKPSDITAGNYTTLECKYMWGWRIPLTPELLEQVKAIGF